VRPATDSRRGRRALALGAIAALALLVPLVAFAATRGAAAPSAATAAPDFAREIAPIVQAKCAGCHRLGGIAPFAFRTEADVAGKAAAIVAAVESRRMPPWPPGAASPRYVGQDLRTLSAAQRATLLRWARAQLVRPGAPRSRTPVGTPPAQGVRARPGEATLDLRLPSAYTPRATGGATDDYRCFLLDPKLAQDAFVTSARIAPGADALVHHVILYRVLPDVVGEAERLDRAAPGLGWTCFGGSGVRQPLNASGGGGSGSFLDDAGWISAWAPGWGGDRLPAGIGISLPQGSRVVMQVHYNLLNGKAPDRSRAVLTTVPATKALTPVHTMLLPAPVELACPRGSSGPLCDRTAAQFDQIKKYGGEAGLFPTGLLLLCKKNAATPQPTPVASCDRTVDRPTTIRAAAGHMHLLGRSVKIELNPGTPRAKVLLDIPRWDFHWQASYVLRSAVRAAAGDVVRVTCRHDATLRERYLPDAQPRYVLWGEGTTDEMCLGILQVTRG
jgi:mono/diheme cytochrome c family protein